MNRDEYDSPIAIAEKTEYTKQLRQRYGIDKPDLTAELVEALERFVAKHFTPGSKANRPDYVVTVPTADIYALAAVLAKVKGAES